MVATSSMGWSSTRSGHFSRMLRIARSVMAYSISSSARYRVQSPRLFRQLRWRRLWKKELKLRTSR